MTNLRHMNTTLAIPFILAALAPVYSQSVTPQKKTSEVKPTDKNDSLILYSKKDLDNAIRTNLYKAMKANANYANALLGTSKEKAPYLVVVRTKPGVVEIHEQWDDVAIIRSGFGVLKTGAKIVGENKVTNAEPDREWRGASIENAEERNLAPGDFIIIPAMLAHQYIPNTNDTLTYWTIKVRRPR